MGKNKILVTTQDQILPWRGGGGLRVIKIIDSLIQNNFQVEIAAPSLERYYKNCRIYRLMGLSKKISPLLSSFIFIFQLSIFLLFHIHKYDFLVVHNSVAAIPAIFFARIFAKKCFLDISDIHTEYLIYGAKNFFKKLIIKFLSFIEYTVIKNAYALIAVTKALISVLKEKKCLPEKNCVVYDGVVNNFFKKIKIDYNAKSIIHIGGVDKQDGVDLILHAAPSVIKKYPSVKFIIVGDGTELEKIKRICVKNKLTKNFIFTGRVPYSAVMQYLQKSSIGLITRPDILGNNLVITVKLLEYWASGLAVLSSSLKGIQEVAKNMDNILFFNPEDINDFIDKLIFLLKNPSKTKQIGLRGKKMASKFEWDLNTRQIVKFINKNI